MKNRQYVNTGKLMPNSDFSTLSPFSGFCGSVTGENNNRMTVKMLADNWLIAVSLKTKESTLANYRMKIRTHIIPELGDILCKELTSNIIYEFAARKINQGLSFSYVSDIVVIIKSMFKFANLTYNLENPLQNLTMPKKPHRQVELLSESDIGILKDYILKSRDSFSAGVGVSLYTGLRIGELCALRWEDVDMETAVIHVNHTLLRIQCGDNGTKIVLSEPKSRSSRRVIPIPENLLKILKPLKNDDESFVTSGTEKPTEPRVMQYRFSRLLSNLGLPHVCFHSLRHSFATNAVALGFDIKALSEILGHSSVNITLNRYVHSSIEQKRSYMELIK